MRPVGLYDFVEFELILVDAINREIQSESQRLVKRKVPYVRSRTFHAHTARVSLSAGF